MSFYSTVLAKYVLAPTRVECRRSALTLLDVVKSNAEAEASEWKDWLSSESFHWLVQHAPFARWSLEKLSPSKIKPHHTDVSAENMEDIRSAKSPDSVPPIVLDERYKTIDGAHRATVAKQDKWGYIWAWVPDKESRLPKADLVFDADVSMEDLAKHLRKMR